MYGLFSCDTVTFHLLHTNYRLPEMRQKAAIRKSPTPYTLAGSPFNILPPSTTCTMASIPSPPTTPTPSRSKSALGLRSLVDKIKSHTPSTALSRSVSTTHTLYRHDIESKLVSTPCFHTPRERPKTRSSTEGKALLLESHRPLMVPLKTSPLPSKTPRNTGPDLPPHWFNPDPALRKIEEEWRKEARALIKQAQRECLSRAECIAITDPLGDLSRERSPHGRPDGLRLGEMLKRCLTFIHHVSPTKTEASACQSVASARGRPTQPTNLPSSITVRRKSMAGRSPQIRQMLDRPRPCPRRKSGENLDQSSSTCTSPSPTDCGPYVPSAEMFSSERLANPQGGKHPFRLPSRFTNPSPTAHLDRRPASDVPTVALEPQTGPSQQNPSRLRSTTPTEPLRVTNRSSLMTRRTVQSALAPRPLL